MHRTYFANLDALRTVACMAVIFQHGLEYIIPDIAKISPLAARVLRVMCMGDLGVTFFFTLSGFLITYLMVKERNDTSHFSIPKFYMRRVLRIWPVYFLTIILGIALQNNFWQDLKLPEHHAENYAYYFAFIANWDSYALYSEGLSKLVNLCLAVTWSVSIEEQFYLLWPLIFFFSRKYFTWVVVLIFALCGVLKAVNAHDHYYLLKTPSGFFFLSFGSLLGYAAYNFHDKLKSYFRIAGSIGVYGLLFSVLLFRTEISNTTGTSFICDFIYTICFGYILLEQTIGARRLLSFSRIPLFTFIGKYTYGMYLYHPIIIALFAIMLGRSQQHLYEPFLRCAGIALGTFIMAYISYELMEKRFLKLKEKFSNILSKSA
ncbi:MAG: acyltransferase family protein [Flavobacteriales bacterium]